MTEKEIVKALRACASGEAEDCPFTAVAGCDGCPKVSADLIERLTAENAALLEYAKTMQECEMCKNDSFCHLRDPMKDDCKHCQKASDCPCQKCEENNCWEWRGLPEAPEGGEKA